MSEQTLVKKLAKVMQEIKYIQKRGKNIHFGYMYATEADVAEKVREFLSAQNVIMLPSVLGREFRETETAKGRKEYICTVDMEFTFHDGDSGETLTIKMSGDGQDGGDKAIFKAITGCTKYAQMKAFMIPTGDDPEDDSTESGRKKKEDKPSQAAEDKVSAAQGPATDQDGGISKLQAKRMFALAGGEPGIVKSVLAAHKYERSEQVQKTEYDVVCKEIEAARKEHDEKIASGVDAAADQDERGVNGE